MHVRCDACGKAIAALCSTIQTESERCKDQQVIVPVAITAGSQFPNTHQNPLQQSI